MFQPGTIRLQLNKVQNNKTVGWILGSETNQSVTLLFEVHDDSNERRDAKGIETQTERCGLVRPEPARSNEGPDAKGIETGPPSNRANPINGRSTHRRGLRQIAVTLSE